MNDGCQTTTETQARSRNCAGRQFFAILGAAIVLGLVYNVASPLGVRAPKSESQAAGPTARSNTQTPPLTVPVTTNAGSAPTAPTTHAAASAITWVEVKPLLAAGQVVLVDARAKVAYDIEHIPDAVLLSAVGTPDEFMAFALKYPKDTAIVTYCGSDNCDLSHELAERLKSDLGFTNVRHMPGGIAEYRVSEGKASAPGSK